MNNIRVIKLLIIKIFGDGIFGLNKEDFDNVKKVNKKENQPKIICTEVNSETYKQSVCYAPECSCNICDASYSCASNNSSHSE